MSERETLDELANAIQQPTKKQHEDDADYTARLVKVAAIVSEPRWLALKPELQALVNQTLAKQCGGVKTG